MKLYYAPGTCALAVWITLEWTGAEYETKRVVLGSDEYKKINPLGAVPAIEIGEERPFTEAGAILQYIVNSHPESDLGADKGLVDELRFNELVSFISGDVHPAYWPLFLPEEYTTSKDEADLNKVREASYGLIDTVLTRLDDIIGDRDHVYKNKKTFLDAYAYVMINWSVNTPKPYTEYKNLKRFVENMAKDPAVQKVYKESGTSK